MPRKPREFEYEKPIEIMTRYTRSITVPPVQLWRVKELICKLREKYPVKVLNTRMDERHLRMQLYFSKDCGCTLSKVMQWFLTRLAKCVNLILKTHGKVFYDRYISKIIKLFHGLKFCRKTAASEGGVESINSSVSVPWIIPSPPASFAIKHIYNQGHQK